MDNIRELIDTVCQVCGTPELIGKIQVSWNNRFIARMGDARWDMKRRLGIIRFSSALWPKASLDERKETVVHETCHVIADYRHGRNQGHGAAWQELMRLCGYPEAKRCHAVDREAIIARRRQRLIRALCACPQGVVVGPVQAQRIRQGVEYHCRRCAQQVRLS
jgi:SprT protein